MQQSYLDRRLAGMRGSRDVDAKHARLAAAWLMDQVVADAGRLQALEAAWGQADSLTQRGACSKGWAQQPVAWGHIIFVTHGLGLLAQQPL